MLHTPQAAARVERVLQQTVEPELGAYIALRVCVPTCFFMVAKASGYLKDGTDLATFVSDLDWKQAYTHDRGWLRPKLAQHLRRLYGLSIVSWQVNGNHDPSDETIQRMKTAGYLSTTREINFYRIRVIGKTPEQLVQAGYPLIVGVLPGFAKNKSVHAVVITHWSDHTVECIDPDGRNVELHYSPDYVRRMINPTGGGCTIILPKK